MKWDIVLKQTIEVVNYNTAHCLLTCSIYWETDAKGYYLIKDYDDLLPDLPRIVDPANPTNNLYMTGISSYRPNDRARDYEPGDGDWTLFKRYIDTLDLTKTVEEI